MQTRIKRAFYKELAPNNPHLKIRSFKKQKNYLHNYEYETVRVNWINSGWIYNLYFYFDLEGKNIDTKLEMKEKGGSLGNMTILTLGGFFENPDVPPEIKEWAIFNIGILR